MVSFIIIILFFVQKKQKGFTQDLMEARANFDRELFKAQLEIQEQTFQEIAREIHDNVGQILSLAKLGLGTLDLDRKEESKEGISEISDILEKALNDLRYMSRSMNSDIIKRGGLQSSIEMQVGFLNRAGRFNTQFNSKGDQIKLNETKEIILFRIVQEAVNNIIRHATANEICISLCYYHDFLKLEINDNGIGFDVKELRNGNSQINGIHNMENRAKLIGADFKMESQIGSGTQIIVNMPY
jgi:two-component system, NarL family, sensor kinase